MRLSPQALPTWYFRFATSSYGLTLKRRVRKGRFLGLGSFDSRFAAAGFRVSLSEVYIFFIAVSILFFPFIDILCY